MKMCNEQDDIAEDVFCSVDWQQLEAYLDEQYAGGEMATFKKCNKIFLSYEVKNCPHCGAEVKKEDE